LANPDAPEKQTSKSIWEFRENLISTALSALN